MDLEIRRTGGAALFDCKDGLGHAKDEGVTRGPIENPADAGGLSCRLDARRSREVRAKRCRRPRGRDPGTRLCRSSRHRHPEHALSADLDPPPRAGRRGAVTGRLEVPRAGPMHLRGHDFSEFSLRPAGRCIRTPTTVGT